MYSELAGTPCVLSAHQEHPVQLAETSSVTIIYTEAHQEHPVYSELAETSSVTIICTEAHQEHSVYSELVL